MCLEQYYLASRIRHNVKAQAGSEKDSHQKNAAVILASSSAIMATRDSLLHRYWRWLKSWFQAAWKAVLVASRSTEIALRLSPLTILAPLAVLTQSNYWNEVAWRYTISTVQGIGPVAVKFCQWIATRRDIFPPYLCDRLGVLHDRGYPHSWDHTHQVLTDAFGDYKERGLTVEEVVGCGSAAQVYKGSLKETDSKGVDSKRPVAIKVLHPKFSWNVERDLALMQSVADFVHSIPSDAIRMVNLPRATENFGKVLRLQADLTNEARNLQQFRSNFYKDDNDKEKNSAIAFPQPIPGWFSSRVLVEDYVLDAIPISNYLQDSTPDGLVLRRKLAGPLLRAFLKMVFIDNFIHGDLHPGNVMVKTDVVTTQPSIWSSFFGGESNSQTDDGERDEEKKRTRHTIVFLDAGIANSLSRNDQRNLIDLFRAVIFNNGDRAGRLMVERAKYERCSQVPGGVDAFAKGVEAIVSEFHDRRKEGLTLGAVRIGSLLSRVLDLCRVHGVEIDPAMASVVISTLVLEGLGRSLSPELNLIDFAKPFVMGGGSV